MIGLLFGSSRVGGQEEEQEVGSLIPSERKEEEDTRIVKEYILRGPWEGVTLLLSGAGGQLGNSSYLPSTFIQAPGVFARSSVP